MFKFLGFSLAVLAVLVFWQKDRLLDFKQQIIEVINPAVKERRLTEEIGVGLTELESVMADKELSTEERNKKIAETINKIQSTVGALQDSNEKLDLGANLSNLIQKFVPLEEKATPTWIPPSPESSCEKSK